jgi:hypothetical protein
MRQQKQLKTSGKSTDDERILSTSEAIKEKVIIFLGFIFCFILDGKNYIKA